MRSAEECFSAEGGRINIIHLRDRPFTEGIPGSLQTAAWIRPLAITQTGRIVGRGNHKSMRNPLHCPNLHNPATRHESSLVMASSPVCESRVTSGPGPTADPNHTNTSLQYVHARQGDPPGGVPPPRALPDAVTRESRPGLSAGNHDRVRVLGKAICSTRARRPSRAVGGSKSHRSKSDEPESHERARRSLRSGWIEGRFKTVRESVRRCALTRRAVLGPGVSAAPADGEISPAADRRSGRSPLRGWPVPSQTTGGHNREPQTHRR